MNEVTTETIKTIFNEQIKNETDKDRVAKLELLREYFTNQDFAKKLQQYTWEQNK